MQQESERVAYGGQPAPPDSGAPHHRPQFGHSVRERFAAASEAVHNAFGPGSPAAPAGTHGHQPSGEAVGPRPLTRGFWLFVTAMLVAGGLSALASMAFGGLRSEELAIALGFALGCFGYAGFALYRGLWVCRIGFWARSLRPLLITTLGNAIAIAGSITLFASDMGMQLWDDEKIIGGVVVAVSFVLLFFILAFDRVMKSFPSGSYPEIQWQHRPVHPAARFIYLLLAASGLAISFALALITTISDLGNDERIAMLGGGIAAVGLGVFFLRQGLRARRGTFWQGFLRPLVTIAGASAVVISLLMVASGFFLYQDEKLAGIVVAIFSAAFAIFAYLMRGRDVGSAPPLREEILAQGPAATENGLSPRLRSPVSPGWSGAGLFFWLLAIACALGGGVIHSGLAEALRLDEHIGYWQLRDFGEALPLIASAMAFVGSGCVLISRYRSGAAHILRAVIGLACVAATFGCFAYLIEAIHLSPQLVVEVRYSSESAALALLGLFGSIALGIAILSWPARGRGNVNHGTGGAAGVKEA
jgi:hypothetical protein